MSKTKRTKNIAFRLSDDDYAKIERAAAAAGDEANGWCRKAALSRLTERHTFTTNERLMYQEVALLRFLLGHGFKMLFNNNENTAATWKSSQLKPIKNPKRSWKSYFLAGYDYSLFRDT